MIELARGTDGRLAFGFGGDTFNFAVYIARASIEVAYATALGDDNYSEGILTLAAAEGDQDRTRAARSRSAAWALSDRDRCCRRAGVLLLARHVTGARPV